MTDIRPHDLRSLLAAWTRRHDLRSSGASFTEIYKADLDLDQARTRIRLH